MALTRQDRKPAKVNPLELVERVVAANEWTFDRTSDREQPKDDDDPAKQGVNQQECGVHVRIVVATRPPSPIRRRATTSRRELDRTSLVLTFRLACRHDITLRCCCRCAGCGPRA